MHSLRGQCGLRLAEHPVELGLGHGYLSSSDYREVIETLKRWGVVRSGVHVQ